MKSYIFLVVTVLLISCGSANKSKQSQAPMITPLKGYFVKNTIEDTGGLQCFTFSDQLSFSQVCGMGATMSTKPDVPDFNKVIVVAIVGKSTDHPTNINIVGSSLENGTLAISVSEEISDDELSYTLRPLTVASVDKAGVKKVVFRKGGVDISSFSL